MIVNQGGVWKETNPTVRQGGIIKEVKEGWVRQAGVLKQFLSRNAEPFMLSGTFATGTDGWLLDGMEWVPSTSARTDPGAIRVISGSAIGTAIYTFPGHMIAGLNISVSVWARSVNSLSLLCEIAYGVGTEIPVVLQSATLSSSTYAQYSGTFSIENAGVVSIILRGSYKKQSLFSGSTIFDDWQITGTPL